jgi:16S rRNA (guanine527-N7)-methyltransferase
MPANRGGAGGRTPRRPSSPRGPADPARRTRVAESTPPTPAVPREIAESIERGARELGLLLGPEASEQLADYLGLLDRWGRVHNLSAIDAGPDAVRLHLLDSLAIVPALDRHRPQGGVLLDVGSGAGLPGVVIAVVRPQWQVFTVDAVEKKASFVAQVAIELGLRRLEALHGRVETLGDPTASQSFSTRRWTQMAPQGADVVVSRAFASLADFTRLTARCLAPGGVWLAMKGRHPDAELAELREARDAIGRPIDVFHVEPLTVPGLHADRCAVWMRPRPDPPDVTG